MGATTVVTTRERLEDVAGRIRRAVEISEGDQGASPVLVAVVAELGRKSAKALESLSAGDATATTARECVVEVEQAADSAKTGAEADTGASDATREAVSDAHLAICLFKAQTNQD